jgi:hypothetical protein
MPITPLVSRAEHILAQALTLPDSERAAVAAALLESLGEASGLGAEAPAFAAELARHAGGNHEHVGAPPPAGGGGVSRGVPRPR